MGSASREALAEARASLSGPLEATAGVQLLSAASHIGGSPALAAALGDAAAEADAKTKVVEQLFAGLSAGARSVLTAAASARWSTAEEFVEGVEELGIRAEAIANDHLADELLAVADVIDQSHDLELTLGSKLGDPAEKAAIIARLFTGKVSDSTVGVVSHLVQNPRGRRLNATLRTSARIAADEGGSELATVTVAAPLTDAQQQRLAALLEQSAGRPVKVTTIIDTDLIGGVRVQLGDDVIDGSIRSRLEDLRQQLAA